VFRQWKRVNTSQKSLPTHPFALVDLLGHLSDCSNPYIFGCHYLEVKMPKNIDVGRPLE